MRNQRMIQAALVAAGLSVFTFSYGAGEPQTQGAVSFVTGGVGDDEIATMKSMGQDYPLQLVFANKATPNNEYLSDVKVQVKDKSGNVVLDTQSQGPFLMAKLPPGSYTVIADNDGTVKRQSVYVSGKKQQVVFVWNDRVANNQ